MWDPEQYERFAAWRARPYDDLVARLADIVAPQRVVDLGCGPGTLTATLSRRWPTASVLGLDSSPEMIEQAQRLAVPGRLEFRLADVRDWQPDNPVDVLVSNATLQWVPGHLELLPRLVAALAPGGALAFQVPGNFDAPSHQVIRELRESPRWRDRLGTGADRRAAVAEPVDYLAELAGLGLEVDAWETTYLHVLPGDDAVLEWVKGTALRPVLAALDDAAAAEFLAECGQRLAKAYPPAAYGTVLPFRRLFVVARRPGGRPAGAVSGLDHVQLAMPPGGEDEARRFYADALGLVEVPKPPALAARGGAWFRGHGGDIHLGAEQGFRPARKAHPGIRMAGIDAVAARLQAAGFPVAWDGELPGHRRFYVDDPFGNRLELLEPVPAGRQV